MTRITVCYVYTKLSICTYMCSAFFTTSSNFFAFLLLISIMLVFFILLTFSSRTSPGRDGASDVAKVSISLAGSWSYIQCATLLAKEFLNTLSKSLNAASRELLPCLSFSFSIGPPNSKRDFMIWSLHLTLMLVVNIDSLFFKSYSCMAPSLTD